MQNKKCMTGSTIAGKYLIGPMIGKGTFGEVYLSTVDGQSKVYAVKKQVEQNKNILINEVKILKLFTNIAGFTQVHWFGHEDNCNFMVMDLLGPSLQDLFNICQRRFSLKTVLMLADQMIHKLQIYHSMHFVHRDLKAQNFLTGIEDFSHVVHFIDFGLSKRFRDHKTLQHYPYRENRGIVGTIRFSSINTHYGFEQSRRDDMEALGYILIYFLQGGLPWQGVKANNRTEKCQKILQKKISTPIEAQCIGLPIQFPTYINYCRTLKFQQRPDYKFLRKLFRQLFDRLNFTWDYDFDWCQFLLKKQKKSENMHLIIQKKGIQINNIDFQMNLNQKLKMKDINQNDINIMVNNDIGSSLMVESNNGSQNVTSDNMESGRGSQNVTSQNFSENDRDDGSQNVPNQTFNQLQDLKINSKSSNSNSKNGFLRSFQSNFKENW